MLRVMCDLLASLRLSDSERLGWKVPVGSSDAFGPGHKASPEGRIR